MSAWNKILDTNGQQVGKLIAIEGDDQALVEITVGGKSYLVNVSRSAIGGLLLPPFNYTTNDCTGTRYTDASLVVQTQLVPVAFVDLPGWTIYDKDPAFPPTSLTINSSGTVDNCTITDPPDTFTVVKLIPVINLASLYQAPFTLA